MGNHEGQRGRLSTQGALLGLVVLAAAVTAVVLFSMPEAPPAAEVASPASVAEEPALEGRAEPQPEVQALPEVKDPVRYVLDDLWMLPEAQRVAHVRALVARDATFLPALVDWVVTAKVHRADVDRNGQYTNLTLEQTMVRVLRMVGQPAVAPLLAVVDEPYRDRRLEAVRTLGALGPVAGDAASTLHARLQDAEEDRYVRAASLDALASVGDAQERAVPFVCEILLDADCEEELGLACARNLLRIGTLTDPVLEACRHVLREDWYAASRELMRTIAEVGPKAKPLLPYILELTKNEGTRLELWHAMTPALLAVEVRSPEVVSCLADMERTARENGFPRGNGAVAALGTMGALARPALEALFREGTDAQRLAVLSALSGPGADVAFLKPLYVEVLAAKESQARTQALSECMRLTLSADLALEFVRPTLARMPKEDLSLELTREVRQALQVLSYAKDPGPALRETLTELATSRDDWVGSSALSVLAQHGVAWPDHAPRHASEGAAQERFAHAGDPWGVRPPQRASA